MARYVLRRPVVVRYSYWVRDVFLHQFGNRAYNGAPVWPDLRRALLHTSR
jgi:ABC-type dipeptide/oligopeptide/nickel transport system permease component